MSIFGKGLREIRKQRGLTLTELGKKCVPPTDRTYLSKIENGKATAGKKVIKRLSKALDVTDEFLQELAKKDEASIRLYSYVSFSDELTNSSFQRFEGTKTFNINHNKILGELENLKFVINNHQQNVSTEPKLKLIQSILNLDTNEVEFFQGLLDLYLQLKINQHQ